MLLGSNGLQAFICPLNIDDGRSRESAANKCDINSIRHPFS